MVILYLKYDFVFVVGGNIQNIEQEAVQLDQSERHSPTRSQLTGK